MPSAFEYGGTGSQPVAQVSNLCHVAQVFNLCCVAQVFNLCHVAPVSNRCHLSSRANQMDTRRFHKILFDASRRLLPRESSILCAVSGGPDSMAMLYALHRLNELRSLGWRLAVAHLDHHLPPNHSSDMAALVREHASALGLPHVEDSVNVPSLAGATGESIEEAGRKARYAFLECAADQVGATFIAVAHHADDQAETILHRIVRGTSLKGLAGIPERRRLSPERDDLFVVRPLLGVRRADIVAYLDRRGIPSMHDATNDDTTVATRNLIRHELLPMIRQRVNPRIDSALVRLGRHARHAADFISETADAAYRSAIACDGCEVLTLKVAALSPLPKAVLGEVLLSALRDIGAVFKPLAAERIDAIASALAPNIERRTVQLPHGLMADRRGKYLYLKREAAPESADPALSPGLEENLH